MCSGGWVFLPRSLVRYGGRCAFSFVDWTLATYINCYEVSCCYPTSQSVPHLSFLAPPGAVLSTYRDTLQERGEPQPTKLMGWYKRRNGKWGDGKYGNEETWEIGKWGNGRAMKKLYVRAETSEDHESVSGRESSLLQATQDYIV